MAELYFWRELSSGDFTPTPAEGIRNCPLGSFNCINLSATGSTCAGVMHLLLVQVPRVVVNASSKLTRFTRSVTSRFVSVSPGSVGTPLNDPFRASLTCWRWYEPKKN